MASAWLSGALRTLNFPSHSVNDLACHLLVQIRIGEAKDDVSQIGLFFGHANVTPALQQIGPIRQLIASQFPRRLC